MDRDREQRAAPRLQADASRSSQNKTQQHLVFEKEAGKYISGRHSARAVHPNGLLQLD
jgi:hypothetical protein